MQVKAAEMKEVWHPCQKRRQIFPPPAKITRAHAVPRRPDWSMLVQRLTGDVVCDLLSLRFDPVARLVDVQ